jgi:hypothetical protein
MLIDEVLKKLPENTNSSFRRIEEILIFILKYTIKMFSTLIDIHNELILIRTLHEESLNNNAKLEKEVKKLKDKQTK